jgi:hypothetical protein
MPGKRLQFDDETWQTDRSCCPARQTGAFRSLPEAFADLLKKHKPPVGLKAALKESVGARGK